MDTGDIMARMAADEMVDITRDMLGGETSETISDTRILRFLNRAYMEEVGMFSPDQLSSSTTITTSSGTAAYELSVDTVLSIEEVVNTTAKMKMYSISEHQYIAYTQGNSTSGSPIYYYISGVGSNNRFELTFFPTPNATQTITVHCTLKPTELVLTPSATSTVLPEQLDEAIIYRAAWKGWMQLGDPERGFMYLNAAKAIESLFSDTINIGSETPLYLGSRVGNALRNV